MSNHHISKVCSDFLRSEFSDNVHKLKASHAHELIAAFFGYKSHSSLLFEKEFPLSRLENVELLIPDIDLIESRRQALQGLSNNLPNSIDIANRIVAYLRSEGVFSGDVWITDDLGTYVIENVLMENIALVDDSLSGVMAETNAYFDEMHFDDAEVKYHENGIIVNATGTYSGQTDEDRPFCGDTIDISAEVTFNLVSGKIGFSQPDISVGGSVNDDWVDPEFKGPPLKMRPKEQFIEETGGFIVGESKEESLARFKQIQSFRNKMALGKASVDDIDKLSKLINPNVNDEFEFV